MMHAIKHPSPKSGAKTLPAALAVALVLLIGLESTQGAGGNPRAGIVQIPIAGKGADQVGGKFKVWIDRREALESQVPPKELAELRKHPPFKGKTDAEITDKMKAIRKNVETAIDRIGRSSLNAAVALSDAFYSRRLCLEFSSRKIAGTVMGTGKGCAPSRDLGVAIKIYACDVVPEWDPLQIKMTSTLLHEGIHLRQKWPGQFRTGAGLRGNVVELDKRILFQCNEIEASTREQKFLDDVLKIFFEFYRGNPLPTVSKSVRQMFDEFRKTTPPAEQMEAADKAADAARRAYSNAKQTKECREQVKRGLTAMRDALKESPPNWNKFETEKGKHLQRLRHNGCYRLIGSRVLDGLFSLDLLAGGGLEVQNVVRQLPADGTPERWVVVPEVTAISDLAPLGPHRVVCGGPYSGDDRGVLVLIEDTDGDGLLDSSSRRMVVDSFDLGGGVGLACQPGTGDLYILARESQMVYKIEGVSPDVGGAFPTTLEMVGSLADLDNPNLLHLHFSPDGTKLFALPEIDSVLLPGDGWACLDTPVSGPPAFPPIRYDAFKERVSIPTFGRLPSPGDMVAEVFGTPGRVVSLFTTSPGPMVLLGSNSCGPNGLARIDLSAPLEDGQRCQLSDAAGLASPEFFVAPAPGSVLIDPTFEPGSEFSLVLSGPPDLLLDLEQSASLDSWAKAGVVALDGWGRGGFPLPLDKQSPGTQFLRTASPNNSILALSDTYTLVCPGVEFDFCVADNDLFPRDFFAAGGRFEVVEGPEGHENLFTFNENGKGSITGLTDVTEVSFTYELIRGDGTPPVGPIEVTFEFNRTKFAYLLPPLTGADLDVLCLNFGGLHYPLYQFRLTNNPFDNEPRPHWHWFFGVNVSALESPMESIPDPNPTIAGFGVLGEVSIVSFRVAYTDWLIFLESSPLQ